jgi:hypothetical protein
MCLTPDCGGAKRGRARRMQCRVEGPRRIQRLQPIRAANLFQEPEDPGRARARHVPKREIGHVSLVLRAGPCECIWRGHGCSPVRLRRLPPGFNHAAEQVCPVSVGSSAQNRPAIPRVMRSAESPPHDLASHLEGALYSARRRQIALLPAASRRYGSGTCRRRCREPSPGEKGRARQSADWPADRGERCPAPLRRARRRHSARPAARQWKHDQGLRDQRTDRSGSPTVQGNRVRPPGVRPQQAPPGGQHGLRQHRPISSATL